MSRAWTLQQRCYRLLCKILGRISLWLGENRPGNFFADWSDRFWLRSLPEEK